MKCKQGEKQNPNSWIKGLSIEKRDRLCHKTSGQPRISEIPAGVKSVRSPIAIVSQITMMTTNLIFQIGDIKKTRFEEQVLKTSR